MVQNMCRLVSLCTQRLRVFWSTVKVGSRTTWLPASTPRAEANDGKQDYRRRHLVHDRQQPASEAESVKQPEEKATSSRLRSCARSGQKTFCTARQR